MNAYSNAADLPIGGWRNRQIKAIARLDAQRSPLARAKDTVRACMLDVSAAESEAHARWTAQNQPIPSPLPATVHPHVHELVSGFLAERGITSPLSPLREAIPLDAFVAISTAEARQRYAEAERDFARLETQEARFAAMVAAGPAALAEPVVEPDFDDVVTGDLPRRGRPRKDLSE